ncbi:hypothetical protein B0H10DRAFT_1846948, partial [Mycena sp. CBHHK59/15]
MYVWLRESRLDETKGHKEKWTYSGPYIIHQKRDRDSFILRELSGAILKGHVNIRRLRLFYFRPENQTLHTNLPAPPATASNTEYRLDLALQAFLWCAASTAKFNEHKTVLLPFGRSSYRQKVIGERRINSHSPIGDIDPTIKIVPDGESCRMLGAWIGNNIPYTTPWPSVLEKINTDLMRWQATH